MPQKMTADDDNDDDIDHYVENVDNLRSVPSKWETSCSDSKSYSDV